MPDFTMCINRDCSERLYCVRYLARPSPEQSYGRFSGGRRCPEFDSAALRGERYLRPIERVDFEVEAAERRAFEKVERAEPSSSTQTKEGP